MPIQIQIPSSIPACMHPSYSILGPLRSSFAGSVSISSSSSSSFVFGLGFFWLLKTMEDRKEFAGHWVKTSKYHYYILLKLWINTIYNLCMFCPKKKSNATLPLKTASALCIVPKIKINYCAVAHKNVKICKLPCLDSAWLLGPVLVTQYRFK